MSDLVLGVLEERLELAPDLEVAAAGSVVQAGLVEDGDLAAAVADEAGTLPELRAQRHGGSPDAEHLAEGLV